MKHNLEGNRISSNDDEFSDTSIESFSGFVGTFFNLFESSTLSNEVINIGCELFFCKWLSSF